VQAETLGGIRFGAVFFVPDDWASGLGELNANLVSAAGHQGQLSSDN
jgi:hypothetical protein